MCGSPPRLRGAQENTEHHFDLWRITPAFAGSTFAADFHAHVEPDHPRVCGEHLRSSPIARSTIGSPPRLRGALIASRKPSAGAVDHPRVCGEHGGQGGAGRGVWDHPRVCGEHGQRMPDAIHNAGSPPRLRGARVRVQQAKRIRRITPAFAGSTPLRDARRCAESDHPRVCGEHGQPGGSIYSSSGSPPRLRGAPERLRQARQERGITPAFAGSTCSTVNETMLKKDHPRVCGEHPRLDSIVCTAAGSPPRLRGARTGYWVCAPKIGITPAFAGSTGICATAASAVPDHPRVCGEHLRPVDPRGNRLGSPPRLRGAPRTAPQAPGECRITPAFAGSTAQ